MLSRFRVSFWGFSGFLNLWVGRCFWAGLMGLYLLSLIWVAISITLNSMGLDSRLLEVLLAWILGCL